MVVTADPRGKDPHWTWSHNGGMSKTAARDASTARAGLKSAGLLGGVGLGLAGLYATSGFGIPCPWRLLTHTLCPLCGSTHLGVALLHGDLAGAWAANQLVFVLLVGLGVSCIFWVIELAGGPRARLPRRLGDQRLWYALLGVSALVFTVARNLAT